MVVAARLLRTQGLHYAVRPHEVSDGCDFDIESLCLVRVCMQPAPLKNQQTAKALLEDFKELY